ncbi:glycoside hydrolase family 88 protein [Simiduia curdlanivorans]|uniref:DUF4861 family protein n=1 Tax=Simiduia curdlanivorans TaxID=1492769 RepID=A0ABV8V2C3_9GAMM|nr:glycoside hydrolase family 88 protein [Simiduia curdlanivorans]MDN3637549.1 glycoside hydrolase family 88 protein [Simiduia curdlanivorans]
MKNFLLLFSITLLTLGCDVDTQTKETLPQLVKPSADVVATVKLSNPSEFERNDELVWLPLERLGTLEAPLSVWLESDEVPSQLVDGDGDGNIDHLVALVDLAAAEKMVLAVKAQPSNMSLASRTQAEISIKQGGAWQEKKYIGGQFVNVDKLIAPIEHTDHSEYIRYEGPGIESDKVGYRIYLDWRNGFDIFGKSQPALALQKVGLDGFESYHHAADWGLDILKVGESLGMGGFGYWHGDRVERVAHADSRAVTILQNGPLVSSFAIDYGAWAVADKRVDLRAVFTMQAGSRLVHVQLQANEPIEPLAIGLGKAPETVFLSSDDNLTGHAYAHVGTWGKQSLAGDNLGMGLLFKQGLRTDQTEDAHNWVSVMKSPSGTLDYYFLAAWSGEPDGIKTEQGFKTLLEREAEKLTLKLRVSIDSQLSASLRLDQPSAESVLDIAERMADTEYRTKAKDLRNGGWDPERDRPARWEYTTGLLMQAFDDLSRAGADPKFSALAEQTISSFIDEQGNISSYRKDVFNIDDINAGKMLLRLYQRTGEEKYKLAAGLLRDQLSHHPKTTNGAFWHKQRYPFQLWLDGVYMGMPFLAEYSKQFEQGESFAEAVHEFEVAKEKLSAPSGLLFHAWDEKAVQNWADPETGLSKYHWSRGMGWYAMALVDVLEILPEDQRELRAILQQQLTELAVVLVRYQDESGVWYQITDMPNATGNYLEASASSMFVYALAKGINLGLLPETYKVAMMDGYRGIVREFVSLDPDGDVHLNGICQVAGLGFGRDGSYHYYQSEPIVADDIKGMAPFLMASVQISKLLSR